MRRELSRRALVVGTGASLVGACTSASQPAPAPVSQATLVQPPPPAPSPLAELEASVGGRVGVYALDTGSGRELAQRADERFAMCSTFKWALVAAVLARVDKGELSLDERVTFGPSEVLEYAPATREHVAEGWMTLQALAEAAVVVSDNTAANLLLAKIDGPAGLTRFFRGLGDPVTRLDRDEPTLNTNLPGDPRDTTSPRAMVSSMKAVLTGSVLSRTSRERLLEWLRACRTGLDRLRKGLPSDWTAGDKTGTGNNGAANDVAIVWPPGRAPILIAAYLSDSSAKLEALTAAHARIGGILASTLGSRQ